MDGDSCQGPDQRGPRQPPMTKAAFVARSAFLNAIEGKGAQLVNELGCPLDYMTIREHQAWRQEPHSGGPRLGPALRARQCRSRTAAASCRHLGRRPYMFAQSGRLPPDYGGAGPARYCRGAQQFRMGRRWPVGGWPLITEATHDSKPTAMPLNTRCSRAPTSPRSRRQRALMRCVSTRPKIWLKAFADAIRHIEEKRKPALVEVTIPLGPSLPGQPFARAIEEAAIGIAGRLSSIASDCHGRRLGCLQRQSCLGERAPTVLCPPCRDARRRTAPGGGCAQARSRRCAPAGSARPSNAR